MQLVGRNKGVYGIAEKQQVCLFQLGTQGRKVLFVAFDALAYGHNGELMFRVQGLQIQSGMYGGGIAALGAGIQDEYFHGCSSISVSRRLYQPISNSAAAMP